MSLSNTLNVLLVSTNNYVRQQMQEGLVAHGCEVRPALDGEAALEMLKNKRVDVVITSDDLLGMNGAQLSRAVCRVYPHLPVLVVANSQQPDQVAQLLSSGASDVLSENMLPDEIFSAIERSLERRAAATHRIMTDREGVLFKAIRVVTAAIDAKSHFAARHSGRVTQLSLTIGARLGLTVGQTATLELAAQLHDIGKIGTPEAVLSKPGSLTDEEWVDVLKHPALGGMFLSVVPELAEIASVVRHHHEHFDGTGYPDGLQGEAIPLLSRIIAVADAYEAITSERPYRHALPQDNAVEEMQSHAGTQFDASIVAHLLEALREASGERKAA